MEAPATEERRTIERSFAHCYDNRCNEKDPSSRAPEHSQATVDSCRCIQSESDLSALCWIWHPTGVEKPPVLPTFCAFSATPSLLSACESHKLFLLAVPTSACPRVNAISNTNSVTQEKVLPPGLLVLLCHKRRTQQNGQQGSRLSRNLASLMRRVAIECGLCRSARMRRTAGPEVGRNFLGA